MKKKTVFITGATSGVGLHITKMLLAQGYNVWATGRNEVALTTLRRLGATVLQADLTNPQHIDCVCQQLPALDVAIFSAGVGTFALPTQLVDEQIAEMIDVNITAPILLTKRIAKMMMERKQGHLVFIGSQAGKIATPKASVYAATKHAIVGFTNGLRMELAPYNVYVTAVHPGPIDTPFIDKADHTNMYKSSVKAVMLQPEKVALATIRVLEKRVREINLPFYMGMSSKLYALAPQLFETVGKRFFHKK